MTSTDVQIDDWVIHRPNVVRSVTARVPGVDADEAASRALEKMIRIVNNDGEIADPAAYWRRAALHEAYSITREAGRTVPVEVEALAGITPPVAGAELDAERAADVAMLRDALRELNADDRKLLFDRHVDDMAVTDIAGDLGVRPHAVTMRLRRAEERLAGAFAAAHASRVDAPECRTTRAAMHDYLKGRLLPRRSKRLELHLDGCADCTSAFLDVREVSWMLRELGQHLAAFFFGGAAVSGAAAVAGAKATPRPKRPTAKQAVAASVLAALALAGGAWAYTATEPDTQAEAAAEVTADGGSGDGGGAGDGSGDDADPATEAEEPEPESEPETEDPPSVPPEDPQPREEFPPPLDEAQPEDATVPAAPTGEPEPAPDEPPAAAPAPEPAPEQPADDGDLGQGNDGPANGGNDGPANGGNNGSGDGGGTGDGGGQPDPPEQEAPGGLGDVLGELPLGGLEGVLGGLDDIPLVGDLINLPLFGDLATALGGAPGLDDLTGGAQEN
ncbi:zf-HC2 domain-containing protein [Myceligenerans xiligouense]|uniref:RNA polymerase sigma factor (Sigma-70 family) n=1 Tax=Myceligenerans xiligouense TaxID=253184 RepID=A0A3N4YV53_9MICO|nr:sigma-70 family RNA polymerase sigma factor [Myceligenerans xiligouense]RPF23356.1 RNA polymerase sigma factor (sigma-70 family) [Myceligenerans xiligouense]